MNRINLAGGKKILIIPIVSVIGFFVFLGYSFHITTENARSLESISEVYFPILEAIDQVTFRLETVKEQLNGAVIAGDTYFIETADELAHEINNYFNKIYQLELEHPDEIQELQQKFSQYYAGASEVAHGLVQSQILFTDPRIQEMTESQHSLQQELSAFREYSYLKFTTSIETANQRSNQALIVGGGIAICTIVVISIVAWLITLGIIINNRLNKDLVEVNKMREIANERLEVLNQDLDNRVKQRTQELVETNDVLSDTLEKLKKTQDNLVESNKMAALGQLVSGIAHEINTPISIIITAISYLSTENEHLKSMLETNQIKKSTLKEKVNNMENSITMIESNIKRTSNLIKVFKETSIESQGYSETEVNLSDFFSKLLPTYNSRFTASGIQYHIDCSHSIKILSDLHYLEKVFNYFIENSITHAFTDDMTDKRIELAVKQQDNDIIIDYKDNGIGIASENKDKIFDPFFTTKRSIGCKGLGLSVIFNVISHALKGNVKHLASEAGAVFRITLPR